MGTGEAISQVANRSSQDGQYPGTEEAPRCRHKYQKPPGHRVVHVVVPESTYIHVHTQASLSGMRFSHYMAEALKQLVPIKSATAHDPSPIPPNTSSPSP